GLLGDLHQLVGILDRIRHRDFDQYVLASAHHLLALAEVHLGRRGEDHGIGALDAFGEVAGPVLDAVFLRHLGGGILIAANERRHLDIGNALERIEMLLPESALPGYADFHWISPDSWTSSLRAQRSNPARRRGTGLLRRFAPRNDGLAANASDL